MGNISRAIQLALGKLAPDVLDMLTEQVVVRKYEAGSVVCHEGEFEPIFYIVEAGQVAFTKKMVDGDQLLGIKAQGEFFGELAVLDHAPRAATVHAISDCNIIEIHEDVLEEVLDRSPPVARTIMRGIIRSVRDTDRITIAELQLKNNELAKTLENLRAAQEELLSRERMKRDLEIAVSVHQSILPTSFPDIPGYEFAAISRPAREVGGDMYDVIEVGDEYIGIVMADASGKSVQAAIYMAVVRALFLSETAITTSPAEVAHRIHELLLKATTSDMFVTAFYATIHKETGHTRYIRGGHDRPVYYEATTQTISLLDAPGRFLGLLPNLIVEEASLTLKPGDVLISYSDGVTDAIRPGGEMYGLDRLKAILHQTYSLSANDIAHAITEDIDTFREGEDQPDDLTMLVVKAID